MPPRPPTFQPIEAARFASLAGVPLASFMRRAMALGIDFVIALPPRERKRRTRRPPAEVS